MDQTHNIQKRLQLRTLENAEIVDENIIAALADRIASGSGEVLSGFNEKELSALGDVLLACRAMEGELKEVPAKLLQEIKLRQLPSFIIKIARTTMNILEGSLRGFELETVAAPAVRTSTSVPALHLSDSSVKMNFMHDSEGLVNLTLSFKEKVGSMKITLLCNGRNVDTRILSSKDSSITFHTLTAGEYEIVTSGSMKNWNTRFYIQSEN